MKKYLLILIFLGCVFAPRARAAVVFNTSSTMAFTGKTTATTSIIVGSGSNQMLVITLAMGNALGTGMSASVAGNAATLLAVATGTSRSVNIWDYPHLSPGTYVVSTTWTTATQGTLSVASFWGVNQTSPLDATATAAATATSNPSSTLTTTQNGDVIIDGTPHGGGSTTNSAGGTQAYLAKDSGGATYTGDVSYWIQPSAGPATSSYVLNATAAWTMLQIALKQATSSNLITFNATSTSSSTLPVTSVYWNHTMGSCSNSNGILIVGMGSYGSFHTATATYDNMNMTAYASSSGNTSNMQMFYLTNPPAGTYVVTTTYIGGLTSYSFGGALSFCGVSTTHPIDNTALYTANGANPTHAITPETTNAFGIDSLFWESDIGATASGTWTPGVIGNDSGVNQSYANSYIGPISTSSTSIWNATTTGYAGVLTTLTPDAPSTPSTPSSIIPLCMVMNDDW